MHATNLFIYFIYLFILLKSICIRLTIILIKLINCAQYNRAMREFSPTYTWEVAYIVHCSFMNRIGCNIKINLLI